MKEDFRWIKDNFLEKIEGFLQRFLKEKGIFGNLFQAYCSLATTFAEAYFSINLHLWRLLQSGLHHYHHSSRIFLIFLKAAYERVASIFSDFMLNWYRVLWVFKLCFYNLFISSACSNRSWWIDCSPVTIIVATICKVEIKTWRIYSGYGRMIDRRCSLIWVL